MRLSSLERPSSSTGKWRLTLEIPSELLSDGATPSVHVSRHAIRVCGEADADNDEAVSASTFKLPDNCEPINEDQAVCKLSKRRCRLTVSWPALAVDVRGGVGSALPSPEPIAAASHEILSAGKDDSSECFQTPVAIDGVSIMTTHQKERAEVGGAVVKPASQKMREGKFRPTCIDYSRFESIGDEEDEEIGSTAAPSIAHLADSPSARPAAKAVQGAFGAVVAPSKEKAANFSIDYSRFDGICEEDATLSDEEIAKLWQRHRRLRMMRGEDPLEKQQWRKLRAGGLAAEVDPAGRGLWCKTNLDDEFEAAAAIVEPVADDQLPELPPPEMLTALAQAPGARKIDVTAWARNELRTELVKACATDRTVGHDADVRIDAIVHVVKIISGDAAIIVEADQMLCGYRFNVDVSFSVNVLEKPPPGSDTPIEFRQNGIVRMPELESGGVTGIELTKKMQTSLDGKSKPATSHIFRLRQVLRRLECSLAYFVRRFDRRLLAHNVGNPGDA
eukprot:TRINITY_DN45899_c0_g1_i1.p1 TRINITY_DN45899_c0_g1~~TRINITY_DN45899_c0_g1_i1.p1  ORF type:complete len:505 (-),score=90.72 TRINITY_DN45899_c0_g1_i1:26-1540(-)